MSKIKKFFTKKKEEAAFKVSMTLHICTKLVNRTFISCGLAAAAWARAIS